MKNIGVKINTKEQNNREGKFNNIKENNNLGEDNISKKVKNLKRQNKGRAQYLKV